MTDKERTDDILQAQQREPGWDCLVSVTDPGFDPARPETWRKVKHPLASIHDPEFRKLVEKP
jgi:hypothetical protein